REGVAIIKENTTIEDLQRFTDAVQDSWGIRAIQIHIHRDEGHYEDNEVRRNWKPNYHAHIVWDWINPSTGKSFKLSKADMSKMQDLLAETLQMQRGQRKSETGIEHLERNEFILQKQEAKNLALKQESDNLLSTLKSISNAMDIQEEEFFVHELKTDPLVNEAWKAIQKELAIPIPALKRDEWKEERLKAIKEILTKLQTKLIEAKATQKEEILRVGKALYKQTKKDIAEKIEENRKLHEANEKLTAESARLKEKLVLVDEKAVRKLRSELAEANNRAEKSDRTASMEQSRADKAEDQIREMLSVPEIRAIWKTIKRNKEAFQRQIKQWISNAATALYDFAKNRDNIFSDEAEAKIGNGIIAEALIHGLNPTDEGQRKTAAGFLLGEVDWTGTYQSSCDLAVMRTGQLCEEMSVSKEIVADLMLAAGGKGGVSVGGGGGGSIDDLTNWDGSKRNNGWGRN
ncbi:MAG: hypothetical protein IJS84_02340, partial [Spirochaetales bacterium]|nr:hypothetical protein [Spirochaetales bacterium]